MLDYNNKDDSHLTEADVCNLKLVVVDGLLQAAVKQLHSTTQRTLHTHASLHFLKSPAIDEKKIKPGAGLSQRGSSVL